MKKGIISVISGVTGAVAGAGVIGNVLEKVIKERTEMSDKHLALYLLMNQWVQVKQDGKSLVNYFEAKGYRNIAVYGMNYVGQTLYREIEGSSVTIKYAIDKNADTIYADVNVVKPDAELAEVDAVVVTPITFFEEIEEMLSERLNCPIVSLEDILYEV